MKIGRGFYILLIVGLVLIGFVYIVFNSQGNQEEVIGDVGYGNQEEVISDIEQEKEESLDVNVPSNFVLPFDIEDFESQDAFFSPFGLIRHNKDGDIGHGGIDISIGFGSPIYAIADSEIIYHKVSSDGRGGSDVHLLIQKGEREGEGWGFLIEHITLEDGLGVGSRVSKGQKIGTSAIREGNNHMQLTYLFNDYKFFRDHRCWIEFLNDSDKRKFDEVVEDKKPRLTENWKSIFEDGHYPYKSLAEKGDVRVCYPLGTDARSK